MDVLGIGREGRVMGCFVRACVDNKNDKCTNPDRIISQDGCVQIRLLGMNPQMLYKIMKEGT